MGKIGTVTMGLVMMGDPSCFRSIETLMKDQRRRLES